MTKSEILSKTPEFFKNYVSIVPHEYIMDALENSLASAETFYAQVPQNYQHYRYAKGKWNLHELLQHIIDTERIMSYRALRFSRNDGKSLQGFDQDLYVKNSNASERPYSELLEEFILLRKSNILLFKSFDEAQLNRSGKWDNNEASVAVLGFIIAGHEIHHRAHQEERLKSFLDASHR